MYFEEGLAVNGWASVCDGRFRYLCFFYTLFACAIFFMLLMLGQPARTTPAQKFTFLRVVECKHTRFCEGNNT